MFRPSTHACHPLSSAVAATILLAAILSAHASTVAAQTTHPATMTDRDRSTLREALSAYDAGNMSVAEPPLRELANRYPSNFEANEALGSLYAESGDIARSIPYLEHACKTAPKQAIAHANLGAAYLKLNRRPDAVRELRTAARLDPQNPDTQSNLGQALLLDGQPAEAAHAFAIASAQQPANWDLRYNWALALFNSGATQQAHDVVQLIPDPVATDQVESLRGDIDEKLGAFKQAIQHYHAAAEKNPSDANLYTLTAEFLRHWTWDEAVQIARFGEQRYPASKHFQVAEGVALYASSHYPEAAATFAALLFTDPDNPLYADLLGRSCTLVSEGVSANCSGLEEFAKKHPHNAQAATYAATGLLHRPEGQQDTAQAEAFLRQAIAADPKLADAYFQMGVLQQMRLDWKASTDMLEKAIALRPAFPEAHYRLSRAYAHLGRREDAQHEIALQQQYSQQAKDSLNSRMQEVVTFVLKPSETAR
jgi:tetratricopeptide (TPR) repeat protein